MNKKMKRYLFLGGVAIVTIAVMFLYVNTYIYNFFAATPKVAISVIPSAASVNQNQDFTVSVRVANQSVDAMNLYLIYDPTKVQYYSEANIGSLPGAGFTQLPEGYFSDPILEEIQNASGGKKQIHEVLIGKGLNRPNTVQLNFKFKALTTNGNAVFTVSDNSQVSGVDTSNTATYFDKDPSVPSGQIAVVSQTAEVSVTAAVSIPPSISPTKIVPSNIVSSPTTIPTLMTSITTVPSLSPTFSPTLSPTIVNTVSITPTGGQSNTPTQIPSPLTSQIVRQPTSVDVDMKIRFQGVSNPKPEYSKQIVEVGLYADDPNPQKVAFNHIGNGIWEGTFKLNNIYTSSANTFGPFYKFYVKGPKHIRKKICDTNPTESIPGTYNCQYGNIQLQDGTNTLDFSNIILLAGDLPIQDGVVNSLDFAFIRQNFGSTDPEALARGDLNFDGIIQTDDHTLIKNALDFKYDDE